jgi:tetratricopeptide (TPR) repeat protein
MGKIKHVYRVKVTNAGAEHRFRVTWFSVEENKMDDFEASALDIATRPKYTKTLWKSEQHALETGTKIYRFLNGDAQHLERALASSMRSGSQLTLFLSLCPEVADWPFELLAKQGEFLLANKLHLVRSVSYWGETQEKVPKDRPLKLLFMACSAQDVQPELDFEKEEETIFRVTEKLAVEMDVEDSGSLEGLREQLEQQEFDVVHLSGHASIDKDGKPYFVMEDETGRHHDVYPEDLWNSALIENPPRLLFLSGCRTGETPEMADRATASFARMLVEKYYVPIVLGWGRSVSDSEATFAEQVIYKMLSRGKSIFEAIQRARYDLMRTFTLTLNSAWPLLRLFICSEETGVIVKAGQKNKPKAKNIKHVFLRQSEVTGLGDSFVGRRRQLQQSLRALRHDQKKIGLLILGAGGLGKSYLAGKISERFADYTLIIVHGQLNAFTMKNALKDAFIIAQDKMGIELLGTEKEMVIILENLCATSFRERNYLILLDDFEKNLEGATEGKPNRLIPEALDLLRILLHYLPVSGKMTQVLITSRYDFRLSEKNRDLVKFHLEPIYLTSFGETEQRKKANELHNILDYPDDFVSKQLLEAGCGNPRLMEWLDILMGQMAEAKVPQLLEAVKDKQEEFIKEHVTRKLLQYGGKELTRLLHWFCIYRRPVLIEGLKLVGEKSGLKEWKELVKIGISLGLIEYYKAQDSYRVSPLLGKELLKEMEDQHSCHEAAFTYYKTLDENKTGEALDAILVEELVHHAMGCGEEEIAAVKCSSLVKHLREQLAFRESIRVGTWIVTEKNSKGKLSSVNDALLLNALAYSLEDLGEHLKAIDYYEQALHINKRLLGHEHYNVAIILNNLGEAWKAMGEPIKAISYYEEALCIWRKIYGEKHQKIATALNNLGSALGALGETQKAIVHFEKALHINEVILGKEHPDVACDLNNIGSAWFNLGEYQKAINYFERALKIFKDIYGDKHHHVATTLSNLGEVWRSLKKPDNAIEYYEEALRIDKPVLGEFHPNVARDLNNLGAAWHDLGKYQKAIGYFDLAVHIDESSFGRQHPNVARELNNLGSAYFNLGQNEKAKAYFKEAYAIFRKSFGQDHILSKGTAEWLAKIKDEPDAV